MLLIERKIYDNPPNYEKREIIGIQQYTYPITGKKLDSNLNLTKLDLSSKNESVIQMRERQFAMLEIEHAARKKKLKVNREIASLKRKSDVDFSSGVDTSPCILPSSIKNKNK